MLKKVLVGLSVALLLALSITGVVLAQDPPDPQDGVCPFGGTCGGYGDGPGGGYGMGGFGYRGTMPALLAEELGMTVEELSAALAEGKTVAEIAAEQGVGLADLVAALVAPRAEVLNQAVADGRMTQEQADWMLEEMTEHLTAQLENGWVGGMYGGGYGGGCGMRAGARGTPGGSWNQQGGTPGYRGGRGMRGGAWGNRSTGPRFPSNTL